MSNIDWSKAPEGATHYSPKLDDSGIWCAVFWRLVDFLPVEAWRVEDSGELTHILSPSCTDEGAKRMIARPHQWSGEGLPPAGIDIEVMHGTYGWIGARVVGADGEAAIVRTNDGYAGVFPHEFRPIRTPEQIAADERDAAIEEMWKIYWQPSAPTAKQALGLLWDAGLRFPKGDDQ